MEDPLPENIEGSKRVVHSVNHHVNWGYVALGVGAIVVVVKIAALLEASGEEPAEFEDEPTEIVI